MLSSVIWNRKIAIKEFLIFPPECMKNPSVAAILDNDNYERTQDTLKYNSLKFW